MSGTIDKLVDFPEVSISGDCKDYSINESTKTLHLIPLLSGKKRLVEPDKVFARVSIKFGSMQFGLPALTAMGMQNSWYRLFYDSTKNVVAWQISDKLNGGQAKKSGWRFMGEAHKKSGTTVVSCKRILETFTNLAKPSYKCEIKKYKDNKGLMASNESYCFVEVLNNDV